MPKKSNMPLVSVIVPTYNSSRTLEKCLKSIQMQSYKNIELIVVDNNSKDDTKAIAKTFTDYVYNKGPERSAQRNYGVSKANGEYIFIIDSDMELSETVIADSIEQLQDKAVVAVIIPEESFGEGFWAQCKKLERSFYIGVSWMEAARAFRRDIYLKAGGYNEEMVSGEDWDLSQRIGRYGQIARTDSFINHNEGKLKIFSLLSKKFYYAKKINIYKEQPDNVNLKNQMGVINRYRLFFSNRKRLFKSPLLGVGMLFMKTSEFAAGAIGILSQKLNYEKTN